MDNNKITKELKYCCECKTVKPLIENFYKAGDISYQKRCKDCHNYNRKSYDSYKKTNTKPYVPRNRGLVGFKKLPLKLQEDIIYDLYVKISIKDMISMRKSRYPSLNYNTFARWKRLGQIPTYIPPTDVNGNQIIKSNITPPDVEVELETNKT